MRSNVRSADSAVSRSVQPKIVANAWSSQIRVGVPQQLRVADLLAQHVEHHGGLAVADGFGDSAVAAHETRQRKIILGRYIIRDSLQDRATVVGALPALLGDEMIGEIGGHLLAQLGVVLDNQDARTGQRAGHRTTVGSHFRLVSIGVQPNQRTIARRWKRPRWASSTALRSCLPGATWPKASTRRCAPISRAATVGTREATTRIPDSITRSATSGA